MLLSELNGMVYLCRVDEHWTMEFVSEGCKELTGYYPDQLVLNRTISFLQVMHPDDRQMVWEEINQALAKGCGYAVEYRIICADQSVRWVSERGRGTSRLGDGLPRIHGFIQDITDRYLREKALAEAEYRYRSIFENAIEGIFQSSIDGRYLQVNAALARIYGYQSPEQMVNSFQNIGRQLYVEPHRREQFMREMQESGVVTNFESQVYRADGSAIWISENAHVVRDRYGELLYYEGTVEDISERKAYEQLIAHQATHDSLTDLPNRTLLMDRISQAIHRADRNGVEAAVIFIDLDHFKNINDSLGHRAGDELIKTVAGRLLDCVRDCDTAARIGGDEFVVVLPDLDENPDFVSDIVKRLLAALEAPYPISGGEYLITSSIGISLYPQDGEDAATLLKHADIAMYKSKQIGRNTFQFFTPDLNRKMAERLQLEQQLRMAINERQFELYYQPKFSVSTLQLTGCEALIRWMQPGRDHPVSPSEFIPLAEQTGLIIPIGQWVIEHACWQIRQWLDRAMAMKPVSINLSATQFHQTELIDQIRGALNHYQVDPGLLIIEVTESSVAQEESVYLSILSEIRELGVVIAVDDFGTGFSNMHSLKTMPLDQLKIDRSFITGVEDNKRDRAIYRAMVAMAQHLDLKVVAEGVETAAQLDFLASIGCDEIQGYLLGRPVTAGEFERLLRQSATVDRRAQLKMLSVS